MKRSWMPLLCLGIMLGGCARTPESIVGDAPNLVEWTKKERAKPGPPLEPLPPIRPFETFRYEAQALRDPFDLNVVTNAARSGPRPDANRRHEPLESYALDALKMVGTIGSGNGIIGLLMTPEKVTYKVVPGNYVGQNDGRVTAVKPDRIEIAELEPNGLGGWRKRSASIQLNSH